VAQLITQAQVAVAVAQAQAVQQVTVVLQAKLQEQVTTA